MIVENVKGAQKWVGKARWNFGSFYLWGDVPALMPIPGKVSKVPGFRFDGSGQSFQSASVIKCEGTKGTGSLDPGSENRWDKMIRGEGNKTVGMNWSDQTKRGQDFTRIAGRQNEGVKGMGIHMTYADLKEGCKGFTPNGEPLWKTLGRMHSSKSKRRKEASALIAKIPPTLAEWIAKTFKPEPNRPTPTT